MAKRKAANGQPDPAIRRLMDGFSALYVRALNPPDVADEWLAWQAAGKPKDRVPARAPRRPVLGGKEAKLLQRWLQAWPEAEIAAVMEAFYGAARYDYRVVNSNQDLGAVYALRDYLAARGRRATDRRTNENMDAAVRAMQGRDRC